MTDSTARLAEAAVFIENLRINRESSAGYGGMVTERAHAGCGCWIDGRGAVQHHNCIVLRLRAAIEEATHEGENVNQRYVRNATRLLDEARTEADTNLHRALTAETRVRELEEARDRRRVTCDHAYTQHNDDICIVEDCACEGWNFHTAVRAEVGEER